MTAASAISENPAANRLIRVGVDTGGTFTDFVVLEGIDDEVGMRVYKCPSTPDGPERAILEGLDALGLDPGQCQIVHGSTVATNAVLERKGARVAYVANRGLGDVLTLGRQARAELYNLQPQPQPPPVPKQRCLEVDQRTAADGSEVTALTDAAVDALLNELRQSDVEAVAINLLFSYLNATPEQTLGKAIRDALPELVVCLSSEVLPEQREYERGMATWLNAAVAPLISRYLERLRAALNNAPLAIMQSSARSIDAAVAHRRAVNLLLSGPAGGLLAARHIGSGMENTRLLTFDMGGTSTDVALIDGDIRLTGEGKLAGWPVAVPMVDMHTIGAGGGSIARIDAAGMLQVGPESAGAAPGPVCYGKGGEAPTVTDANLVLGRLPASAKLGGEMALNADAARAALQRLGDEMGCDAESAARAVITLANEHMTEALRVISIQRGEDPADYCLLSFGGAGGLHVCALAEALGMSRAMAPMHAGVLSALGMLIAEPGRELSHGLGRSGDRPVARDVEAVFARLESQAKDELGREGVPAGDIRFRRQADLRYRGQSYCLLLDWQGLADTEAAFHAQHERRYGHRLENEVEWVNLRLSATSRQPSVALPDIASASDDVVPVGRQDVVGESEPVAIYARESLRCGHRIDGPAIVTEAVATTFLDRGWSAEVDEFGHLILTKA